MSLDAKTAALVQERWPFLSWVGTFKSQSGVEINSLLDLIWNQSGFESSADVLQREIDNQIQARTGPGKWTPEIGFLMHAWTGGIANQLRDILRLQIGDLVGAMLANPDQYDEERVKREVYALWASVYTKCLAFANSRLSTWTYVQESYYRPFMRSYFIMNVFYRALTFAGSRLLGTVLQRAWLHGLNWLGRNTSGSVAQLVEYSLRGGGKVLWSSSHPIQAVRELWSYIRTNWPSIRDLVARGVSAAGGGVAALGELAVGVAARWAPPILGLTALAAASTAFGYFLAMYAHRALQAMGVVGVDGMVTTENFAQFTDLPLEERGAIQQEAQRVGREIGDISSSYVELQREESDARMGKAPVSFSFGLRLRQLEERVRGLQSEYGPEVVDAIRQQVLTMIEQLRERVRSGGYVGASMPMGAAEPSQDLEGLVGIPDLFEFLSPWLVKEMQARNIVEPTDEEAASIVEVVFRDHEDDAIAFLERRLSERLAGAVAEDDGAMAEAYGLLSEAAGLLQARSVDENSYVVVVRRLGDVRSRLSGDAAVMVDEVLAGLTEIVHAFAPQGGGSRPTEEAAVIR